MKSFIFDATTAFVPVPTIRTFWLKVHPSCVTDSCPTCHAMPGEPCKGKVGYTAATHFTRKRRRAASPRRKSP